MRKIFNLYEANREKICHSFLFILIASIGPLIGWYFNSPYISYMSLSALTIVIMLMSYDFKMLFLPLPFAMTCFRQLFFFNNIPLELLLFAGIYILAMFVMILKQLILKKEMHLKLNLISKSLLVIGAVAFLSAVVRHIFYNEPASFNVDGNLVSYPEAYNIMFGYLGGVALLALALLSSLITTFKIDGYNYVYSNTLYTFAIFLLIQFLITFIQKEYNFDAVLVSGGIGWCDKNTYCIAVQTALPFAAYIFSKNFKRIDALAVLGALSFIVLASDSRSAQLTLFVTAFFLLYIIISNTKHKARNYMVIVLLGLSLAVGAYFFLPDLQQSINRLFNSIFHGDNFSQIITGRDVFWKWIIDYTYSDQKHMLFGGSTSYLFELYKAFYPNNGQLGIWLCHNTFFTALALGGTLGLIAITYHIIESFGSTLKRLGTLKWPVFTMLLFGFIHGLGDNTFFNIVFMLPYIFILSSFEKKAKDFF